jgi:hypothetical protein
MKRLIALAALALVLGAGTASAQGGPEHYKGACGFHNIEAPAGIRWWLSDKLALDAGLGFGSNEIANDNFSHWALDVGLPIMMRSWDKVHVLLRPGILYTSQEVDINPGPILDKDNDTSMTVGAEIEAEVFLADNFSVSAAHGFAFVNNDPAGPGGSSTDWGTTGSNFTNIGFHIYTFGGH